MEIEMPVREADAAPKFRRDLSGFGVIVLTLSVLSPGASVLVAGGTIVQQAGSGVILAFVLGALVTYCQTAMIAELGAAYPSAGYDYAAVGHAIGDWMGAVTYLWSIIGIPLFLNTSAVGIAIYLRPLFPGLAENTVTYATVGIVTVLALFNIRANERITGLFMLIETIALLLIAVIGFAHLQPGARALLAHPVTVANGAWTSVGIAPLALATVSASWAIAGSNQALYFSEDMKRPSTIGRIIMISFLFAAVLETLPVAGVIVGAHDLKAVLGARAPFEAFLAQYLSDGVIKFVSVAIAIAIFNACLAGFVGIGRNIFSMGRTRLFNPATNRALMRLIPATHAPWVAIALIAVTTALATLLSMRFKVMMLAGATTWTTIIYVWATIAGRRSGRTGHHAYRQPAYPLIPIISVGIIVLEFIAQWRDRDAGRPSMFIWLGMFVLAWLYYRFALARRPGGWRLVGPEDVMRGE